jgi:hypothetical protein
VDIASCETGPPGVSLFMNAQRNPTLLRRLNMSPRFLSAVVVLSAVAEVSSGCGRNRTDSVGTPETTSVRRTDSVLNDTSMVRAESVASDTTR